MKKNNSLINITIKKTYIFLANNAHLTFVINLYYAIHLRGNLYFAGELSKSSLFKFISTEFF